MEKIIEIKDLHKSYGEKEVIKGISLDVYQGEVFGFIGRNGVGKSTTIECMIGIKDFNSGEITLNGKNIVKEPIEAKKKIGYVSSDPICYESMTGYGYISFCASIYNVNKGVFTERYYKLANILNMSLNDLQRPIKDYSHGMKQKVCLIASIIHKPKIWILDEPTVGLDALTAEDLIKLIKYYSSLGNTCFVTSHNIDLVAKICNRVAFINNGKIHKLFNLDEHPEERANLSSYFLSILEND